MSSQYKINVDKKIEKLNIFMKKSKKRIYEWTFYSKYAVTSDYKYLDVYSEIKKVIREEFKKECQIHNLGSRVMGLANDNESDLDIFIDIENKFYWKRRNYQRDVDVVNKLRATLGQRKDKWSLRTLNPKVPSFKVIHIPTGIKCDISVTNGMAVQNSKLFGHIFAIQTEAIAFHHFVQNWLEIFDVNIRGFSLTLLIVLFLQQHNLLPAIHKVQENLPKIILDDFEVQYDETRTLEYYQLDEMKNYKHWLKPFFKFYSTDFYRDKIICTYYGALFEKDDYPSDISRHYPMTIPAPLLRHSNTAKNVKNLDIGTFCDACQFSYKYFDEYMTKSEFPPYFKFDPYDDKITNIEEFL